MTHFETNQLALPLPMSPRHPGRKNGFAQALAIVVRAGREAEWARKATACCPQCGHRGPMVSDFGLRKIRGRELAQSWCRTCRAQKRPCHPQPSLALGEAGCPGGVRGL